MELGFPHAYLAIEPLTGPQEVWFLNAWESEAEQKQVAEDYASNGPLAAALESKGRQKARLTSGHVNVFVHYRRPLSGSAPWNMGLARFFVVTVTKSNRRTDGTVFETSGGTKFVLLPFTTRIKAEAAAAAAGSEARVFAVRPYWSKPAREWIAADPGFWLPGPAVKGN